MQRPCRRGVGRPPLPGGGGGGLPAGRRGRGVRLAGRRGRSPRADSDWRRTGATSLAAAWPAGAAPGSTRTNGRPSWNGTIVAVACGSSLIAAATRSATRSCSVHMDSRE